MTIRRAACLALVLAALLPAAPVLAQAGCVATGQVRSLAKGGDVMPAAKALARARSAASGEIIDTKLCGAPGAWRYVVTILGQDGKVVRVTLDARSGAVLSTR